MRRVFHAARTANLWTAVVVGTMLQSQMAHAGSPQMAVFAGGCFWCVESDFESVPGVSSVISGFTGGKTVNPTYREVSHGDTGHVEAVQILYDPEVISYDRILYLFLRGIDPTDGGGQFCDRGPIYAPAIFPATPSETVAGQAALDQAAQDLGQSLKVTVRPAGPFYPAEEYHQDYYKKDDLILTRFGPRTKASAYKLYREGCGRDARVRAVWGEAAAFAGH